MATVEIPEYVTAESGEYRARVILDSVSPVGVRLTTLEVTFPRFILAEFNTHRVFSRNSASSRAIPVQKQLRRVTMHPFIPETWGSNQKGMQAGEPLDEFASAEARQVWIEARDDAIEAAKRLMDLGVHKQLANRLLEPFSWHTALVTSTDWSNFFGLRRDPDAQPEMQMTAELMWRAMERSTPKTVDFHEWHIPLISVDEKSEAFGRLGEEEAWRWLKSVSVGRCARVSYLTHDGKRDPDADIALMNRLLANRHMSPFEHVARPLAVDRHVMGNLRGWAQVRGSIPYEADASAWKQAKLRKIES